MKMQYIFMDAIKILFTVNPVQDTNNIFEKVCFISMLDKHTLHSESS